MKNPNARKGSSLESVFEELGELHELRLLTRKKLIADQLREVLGGLDQTLNDATVESADDDFGNLTTEQLRALLQSLEG